MVRVSIIGARRTRNGIGEYIAKYFHQQKARVISVLGTTEETSQLAAAALEKYGIHAVPYRDFDQMVERENPDVIVIASPPITHLEYLTKSLRKGLHIFCEKPLLWPIEGEPERLVGEMLNSAKEKGLTVAMNTQLPFALEEYEALCGPIELEKSNRFFIRLSPTLSGKEMIPDSVPHALSLLYSQFGTGRISNLEYERRDRHDMDIRFTYLGREKGCEVQIKLVRKEQPPRDLRFGFNNRIVERKLDLSDYTMSFEYGTTQIRVRDPLQKAVASFLEAVEKRGEPFMGYRHIVNNMSLLKTIYEGCEGD